MNCNLVANHEMYQVLHFSNIDLCIWPPGGINMSKNWKKSKYHRSCSYFTCTMNCKLVTNHEIYQGTTFQSYWFLYLATRGQRHVKNLKKIIILFLFIVYIHNELQNCGKSWNLSGYNISVVLISVFGHQGAATCLQIGRNHIIVPCW